MFLRYSVRSFYRVCIVIVVGVVVKTSWNNYFRIFHIPVFLEPIRTMIRCSCKNSIARTMVDLEDFNAAAISWIVTVASSWMAAKTRCSKSVRSYSGVWFMYSFKCSFKNPCPQWIGTGWLAARNWTQTHWPPCWRYRWTGGPFAGRTPDWWSTAGE